MRGEISRKCGGFALLFVTSLLCAGCSGKGTGETVPSPPRDLVEKSFRPPNNSVQPGARSSNVANSSPTSARK